MWHYMRLMEMLLNWNYKEHVGHVQVLWWQWRWVLSIVWWKKIPEIVAVEPVTDEETGLELNVENIDKVIIHKFFPFPLAYFLFFKVSVFSYQLLYCYFHSMCTINFRSVSYSFGKFAVEFLKEKHCKLILLAIKRFTMIEILILFYCWIYTLSFPSKLILYLWKQDVLPIKSLHPEWGGSRSEQGF